MTPTLRGTERRRTAPPARRRARAGVSLVEVLVAVMLIGVGLLTLAGVAGGVGGMMRGGDIQTTTAMAVQTSLDQLSVVGNCRNLVAVGATKDSTVVLHGVTIHKRLEGLHNIIYVRDSVNMPGRKKPLIYQSMIPCRN